MRLPIESANTYSTADGTIQSTLQLKSQSTITANENVKAGLDDFTLLASYLEAFGIKDDKVLFDLSLAPGLTIPAWFSKSSAEAVSASLISGELPTTIPVPKGALHWGKI